MIQHSLRIALFAALASTSTAQQPPPSGQTSNLLPVSISVTGTAVDDSGTAITDPVIILLRQSNSDGVFNRTAWPILAADGGFDLTFEEFRLDPGLDLEVVLAPADAPRSPYFRYLAADTASEAAQFRTSMPASPTATPALFDLSLGVAQVLDAPSIATVTILGDPAAQVTAHIYPGEVDGSTYQSVDIPGVTFAPGVPKTVYSWEPDARWEIRALADNGEAVPPSMFVRGRNKIFSLITLTDLDVSASSTAYPNLHRITLCPTSDYEPFLIPNVHPNGVGFQARLRVDGMRRCSLNPAGAATFRRLTPGPYTLELWTESDYLAGTPSATASISVPATSTLAF